MQNEPYVREDKYIACDGCGHDLTLRDAQDIMTDNGAMLVHKDPLCLVQLQNRRVKILSVLDWFTGRDG